MLDFFIPICATRNFFFQQALATPPPPRLKVSLLAVVINLQDKNNSQLLQISFSLQASKRHFT